MLSIGHSLCEIALAGVRLGPCYFGGEMDKKTLDELRSEIEAILEPEPDDDGGLPHFPPHPRLREYHGLDTFYFKGPWDLAGDTAHERLIRGADDPLWDTIECVTVPMSLFSASLCLFADSLITYHESKERDGVYRFYPPILMTIWSAFEAWVRISSEMLVKANPSLHQSVKDTLLEERRLVERKGAIIVKPDRRSVLDRYWLLLKYGCNLEYDRGGRFWQAGERVATVRDSLVHYDVAKAPELRTSEMWAHMEAVFLLLIAPSVMIGRSLYLDQYDYYYALAKLQPLISEFEERPVHKGWSRHGTVIFYCPFDGVDATRYPKRFPQHDRA